jgi:hypothetical protein
LVEAVQRIAGNGTGDTRWKVPGVLDWSTGVYNPDVEISRDTTTLYASGVDRTWWSCGAFSVCDGQPTIENSGPCDSYSVSPSGRPPHPSALSHAGIGNVID